jgi:hypothetical protein
MGSITSSPADLTVTERYVNTDTPSTTSTVHNVDGIASLRTRVIFEADGNRLIARKITGPYVTERYVHTDTLSSPSTVHNVDGIASLRTRVIFEAVGNRLIARKITGPYQQQERAHPQRRSTAARRITAPSQQLQQQTSDAVTNIPHNPRNDLMNACDSSLAKLCIVYSLHALSEEERDLLVHEGQHCSICFEDFSKPVSVMRLACGHSYHGTCICQWTTTRRSCPNCRSMLTMF